MVDNAHKFGHKGGYIRISATKLVEDSKEFVQISIEDDGIGIETHEQTKVFNQMGFRSIDPLVREQHGTGLGLYIAHHVVEAHGGRIWFESEPGKGSTFHFTIPVAAQE